ncbi:hypothetical protein GCM10025773_00010 [Microbacterium jejuense]
MPPERSASRRLNAIRCCVEASRADVYLTRGDQIEALFWWGGASAAQDSRSARLPEKPATQGGEWPRWARAVTGPLRALAAPASSKLGRVVVSTAQSQPGCPTCEGSVIEQSTRMGRGLLMRMRM